MRYTLQINRYGRRLTFDDIDDLTEELSRYFSPKEIASGIVDRLTTFRDPTHTDEANGYVKNDYQDYHVLCYLN